MPLFLHQNGGYFIMTETVTKKIPTINAVEGFDPAEFTRQLPNEDGSTSLYLDVKYRLLWFRLHRPQGKIVPDIVHVDEKSAVVSCKLYEDKGIFYAQSGGVSLGTLLSQPGCCHVGNHSTETGYAPRQ